MNIDKLQEEIDKLSDGDRIDDLIKKHILNFDEEERELIREYVEDRKIEIEGERNPSGIDYPLYDHTRFKVSSESWQLLNPDGLSYWQWLETVGLPMFWIQPRPELQYKLLAICCAINTNAIPPRNKGARKEMAAPLLYFYGDSGSGKTEGNFIISQSYPTERFQIIKAEATGTSLRNVCHLLCYRGFSDTTPGYNNLFPAFLLIDNYEPSFLARWGEFKTVLLSVLRTQSFTTTANKDRENDYYYTHLLKSFTSVVPPKAMNLAQSEFARRFVYFFTEKAEGIKSIARYDFSDIPTLYAKTWGMERVTDKWYPLLTDLLKRDDDCSSIPSSRWSQSLCILATGVYIGAFADINEGIEFMTEYWSWVTSLEEDMTNEVATLLDSMMKDTIEQWKVTDGSSYGVSPAMPPKRLPKLNISDISKRIHNGVLAKKGAMEDAKNYLTNIKGWIYHVEKTTNQIDMFYYLPWEELVKLVPELNELDD